MTLKPPLASRRRRALLSPNRLDKPARLANFKGHERIQRHKGLPMTASRH